MKKLLPLLALCAIALPSAAITDQELRAIVPNGFSRAAVFTVNGYAGGTPLTNFPVLVKIAAGSPSGFDYADLNFSAAGEEHDLGFVDMEGHGLAFDLDEWNASGTSIYWVNVPLVTNGTQFVMVYRSAQTGKSLNGNNAFADYTGVWHLGETTSGSTTIKDSTDNHLDGTSHANSSPLAAGAIGGSRQINTTDNNSGMANGIQVPLGAATSAERAVVDGLIPEFTASFWWRHPKNVNTRWNCVIGRKNGNADPAWGLQFDQQNASYSPIRVFSAGTSDTHCQKPACPQTLRETWYKVDLVYYRNPTDATKCKFILYWNGGNTATTNDTYNALFPANSTGNFCIGGGGGRPYRGWMDEVRLRKFVPTADWVKADFDQANDNASFLSAAAVVEFVELPKPVIGATLGDFGAAFAQFSGSVSKLGGSATSCDVYAKVWPVGGTEPAGGTLLASGLDVGDAFTNATVTGLTPQTEYNWAVYAVNDLTPTAYESDPVTGTFETAGVGGAGTGGVVTRVVDDYVHVFEIALDGTATYQFTPPAGVDEAEVLLVAGGGAGGFYAGGGGGAGGLVHDTTLAVSDQTTYTVTVGDGGQPSDNLTAYGTNGGDSLITSAGGATTNAIAFGGGAGGNGPINGVVAPENAGLDGGSGGGSTHYAYPAGSGTTGQGSDGGLGLLGTPNQTGMSIKAGGGGGAGGNGGNAQYGSTHVPGTGGSGVQLAITGTATWYAGGGSGGGITRTSGGGRDYRVAGGVGGGGTGGVESDIPGDEDATPGTDGLGGGGGGGSTKEGHYRGGAGGSGVVVVRYPATGTGAGATEPTVSLTGLEYDSANNVATLSYRVAWAGEGYQTADVVAVWGFSEDALENEVPLQSGLIGRGSGTITTFPSVSRTVYVKVKATNAGNASGVSTETETVALYNPRAPEATLENTAVAVDGGTFSVDVTSLGQGASGAVVSLQSCLNRAFASGVVTNADLATLAATGAVSVAATGLADSSTWWVRAVVTNDIGEACESDPRSITTLSPGYPNASGSVSDIGYTSVSASTRATAVGLGSTSTTRWLEVSEYEDFSTLVGTSTSFTTPNINVDSTLTLTGLSPDTAYHVRIGISNTWNRVAYVLLTDFTTLDAPFAATGPFWTAGDGTFDFSLDVSAVYDGAECEAVLTYGGNEVGTRTFTAAGAVSWNGVAAGADGAEARIVVTATLPDDGGTVTKTFSASVGAGASGAALASVWACCSAANAYWMRPGDRVTLPAIGRDARQFVGEISYQILNERFATMEGTTLVALEPGIVGVRCIDEVFTTNVMGVVILPDAIGSGSVYVYKETGRNGNVVCDWSRPQCWDKVENGARAATNTGCPTNADDIAVLPFYGSAGDQYIRHCTDIAVGGVYAGMIRPDTYLNCHMERYKFTDLSNKTEETKPHTVTFRRTDGKPVEIKACPNSEGGNYTRFVLGGYDIDVVWASDAVFDGCSSETDVNGPRGRFYVKTNGSTNTLQNVTLTFQGYPGYAINGNGCTDTLKGVWKGSGTIVKKGFGGIAFDGDFSGFSGTIVERSGPGLGNTGSPAAGVLMRAAGASNVTAHVYGWAPFNSSGQNAGAMNYDGQSRGKLGTGGANVAPAKGAQGPAKGLHLHGGTYRACNIDNSTWGVGVKDEKAFDVLSVGAGFSYVVIQNGAGNGSGKPINAITAKTLAQTDKGTLVVYDHSLNNNAYQGTTNSMFTVEDWNDHAVGGTGCGEAGAQGASQDFPIVPWMVANGDSNYSYLMFPAVDANGRLVRPVRTTSYIDTAGAEDNAIWSTDYGNLTRGSGTAYTVNSLFLNNATSGNRWLGADRTLTITSGGLIFNGNGSAIGLPGRDDNGTLVLGDATHPAYVWAKAYGNGTNYIWAAVTAPGGFVSTYTGNLELGGAQTNIAEEIVADAGCLSLGDATHAIALANGLPLRVCAGATLKLSSAAVNGKSAFKRNPVKIDGSADAFGTVELPVNQSCASLSVRDVFESDEWTTLEEGTYGSSESTAEFVRDDLFSGPGVLTVGTPAQQRTTLMVIW